jgi:DNA-binding GntR family transcriptional regulator
MMLLRDNIYQAIRSAVLTCEFQPGQELREQVLAERYRVSRSPVRDSLLRLAQENLITVLPRQGYRVKPISIADVEDIFGLHLVVEPACAAAAANRGDDAGLQALDRFRDIPNEDEMEAKFVEYNRAFHRAIWDLSGNARLVAVAVDVSDQLDRLVRVSLRANKYEHVRDTRAEHNAIIDALQAHDADLVSQLAYQHAARSRARILAALGLLQAPFEQPAEEPPTTTGPTSGDGA